MYNLLFHTTIILHTIFNSSYLILTSMLLFNDSDYLPNQIHFVISLFSILFTISKNLVICNVGMDKTSPNFKQIKIMILSSFSRANFCVNIGGLFVNIATLFYNSYKLYYFVFIPTITNIMACIALYTLLIYKEEHLFNYERF